MVVFIFGVIDIWLYSYLVEFLLVSTMYS